MHISKKNYFIIFLNKNPESRKASGSMALQRDLYNRIPDEHPHGTDMVK